MIKRVRVRIDKMECTELSIIRLGAVKHGKIPDKDRVCPSSTVLRRARQRTAIKPSFFTMLDGTRPSLRPQGRARRLLAVSHAYNRPKAAPVPSRTPMGRFLRMAYQQPNAL